VGGLIGHGVSPPTVERDRRACMSTYVHVFYVLPVCIYQGMEFIHKSPLKFHGRLKSSNCVLDGRWMIKITDFGLGHLRHVTYNTEQEKYNGVHLMPVLKLFAEHLHIIVHMTIKYFRRLI